DGRKKLRILLIAIAGLVAAAVVVIVIVAQPPSQPHFGTTSDTAPLPPAPKDTEPKTPEKPTGPADTVTGEMVKLPGGTFAMGSRDAESEDEKRVHEVAVAAFELDAHE